MSFQNSVMSDEKGKAIIFLLRRRITLTHHGLRASSFGLLDHWNFNLRAGPRRRPYAVVCLFLPWSRVTRYASRIDLMSDRPTTTGTFYHGKVILKQPKKGYRFAVDSPILAAFLPRSTRPALEVGCGVGVVALLALQQKKYPAVTGIEIQAVLYRLAVANAVANGMAARFQVIRGDFNRIHAGIANMQTIFCNPPFFRTDRGHVSPDPTIRLARFEVALTLSGLLRGCAAVLAPRGRVFLIFPYARQNELLDTAVVHGLHAARLRPVQPFAAAPPDRFLVQLQKTKVQCRQEAPLVIFRSQGVYTPEMERVLAGS